MDCFLPSHLPHCLIWQIFCIFWQLSRQLAWLISHVLVLVVTPSPQVAEQSDHELQSVTGLVQLFCSVSDWLKFAASYAHVLVLVWIPWPHVVEQSDHDPHSLKYLLLLRYKLIKLTSVHLWLTSWLWQRHYRCFSI